MSEVRKVLEMVRAQQVTVDEALDLLAALDPAHGAKPPEARAQGVKMIRIVVETDEETKVRVNVPVTLAKFALRFVPKDVRDELEAQGIDLGELLGALEGDPPKGRLVDIEAGDDKPVRVLVEVV